MQMAASKNSRDVSGLKVTSSPPSTSWRCNRSL